MTLTLRSGGSMIIDRHDLRVVETIKGGALVTLSEGSQHEVVESSEAVLEMFKVLPK